MPLGRRQRVRRRRVAAAGAAGAYAVHKHNEHKQQEQQEAAALEAEQAPPGQDQPADRDPGSSADSVAQLTELAKLRDSGALTQAEFDAEKQKIIGA